MKNKIWQTIKTRRFLYALLTAVLLMAYAVGSARLWQWLIPWRLLEIIVWFVAFFIVAAYTMIYSSEWIDKHCS